MVNTDANAGEAQSGGQLGATHVHGVTNHLADRFSASGDRSGVAAWVPAAVSSSSRIRIVKPAPSGYFHAC